MPIPNPQPRGTAEEELLSVRSPRYAEVRSRERASPQGAAQAPRGSPDRAVHGGLPGPGRADGRGNHYDALAAIPGEAMVGSADLSSSIGMGCAVLGAGARRWPPAPARSAWRLGRLCLRRVGVRPSSAAVDAIFWLHENRGITAKGPACPVFPEAPMKRKSLVPPRFP